MYVHGRLHMTQGNLVKYFILTNLPFHEVTSVSVSISDKKTRK